MSVAEKPSKADAEKLLDPGAEKPPKPDAVKLPKVSSTRFEPFAACASLKVSEGAILLRYRHKGQWTMPPVAVATNRPLNDVLSKFPPDECALPDPRCLQKRMELKRGAPAGHGIDSQIAAPAGKGDPCALGLPCGLVLPPPADWQFRLEDPAAQGEWVVSIRRGKPPAGVAAEFRAPIAQGRVSANGQQLSPGAVYAYRWLNAQGGERASGEFEVMGLAQRERLKRMTAERAAKAGLGEEAAWVDALAAFELDWDAYQSIAAR